MEIRKHLQTEHHFFGFPIVFFENTNKCQEKNPKSFVSLPDNLIPLIRNVGSQLFQFLLGWTSIANKDKWKIKNQVSYYISSLGLMRTQRKSEKSWRILHSKLYKFSVTPTSSQWEYSSLSGIIPMPSKHVSLHHVHGSEPQRADSAGKLVVAESALVVVSQWLNTDHPPTTELAASLVAEIKFGFNDRQRKVFCRNELWKPKLYTLNCF